MDRRELLIGAAALAAAGPARAQVEDLRAAAREAYLYISPLVEIASVRAIFLGRGASPGRFYGRSHLTTPASRLITTPNNDTLAAQAFIDLARGPARLRYPALGGRYASLALMDMFSNNFMVLDPRNMAAGGGEIVLSAPQGAAPTGAVRAPTPWVWALVRVLVDGPADLAKAAAAQGGFAVAAAEARTPAPGAPRTAPWADYFRAASRLLQENPPLAGDGPELAKLAPLGLKDGHFDPERFKGADVDAIAAGVEDARQSLRTAGPTPRIDGAWSFEAAETGNFGQDYVTRARVALGGLAALPLSEAMYMAAVSPDGGRRFTGDDPWKLRFPPGQTPPVDAFWSLTLYEATPAGQLFLTANPIDRYSIGDRTPGLARDPDGGLTIWIARADPGPERRANWLPAPASGPFSLMLRAYLPKPALVSRAYRPPPVTRA